jgi:hypothetical protein
MWTKVAQLLLQYVVLPLVTKGIEWLYRYFENSREDAKRDTAIDEAVDRLKNAPTPEEKKDALKDLVRGVGALEP